MADLQYPRLLLLLLQQGVVAVQVLLAITQMALPAEKVEMAFLLLFLVLASLTQAVEAEGLAPVVQAVQAEVEQAARVIVPVQRAQQTEVAAQVVAVGRAR